MSPEKYYTDRWAQALLQSLTDEQKEALYALPNPGGAVPLSLIRLAKGTISHLDDGWLRHHVATDIADKAWEVMKEEAAEGLTDDQPDGRPMPYAYAPDDPDGELDRKTRAVITPTNYRVECPYCGVGWQQPHAPGCRGMYE